MVTLSNLGYFLGDRILNSLPSNVTPIDFVRGFQPAIALLLIALPGFGQKHTVIHAGHWNSRSNRIDAVAIGCGLGPDQIIEAIEEGLAFRANAKQRFKDREFAGGGLEVAGIFCGESGCPGRNSW